MLRRTLCLYGKAWISAYCIGFIQCLVITQICFAMQWQWVIRMSKRGEAVSKCLFYMRYHVNIMQCMQPNFLLTGQVYPMLMLSVPHAWGALDRKSTLFKLIVQIFLKGVVFMFWHDILYIELLYYVISFELVWTWNKVAVVYIAKTCRMYPTFPCLWHCWDFSAPTQSFSISHNHSEPP